MRTNPPVAVGYDGSPQSHDAVRWGARDAALRGAPLLLVSTMQVPNTYGAPVGLPVEYFQNQQAEGKQRLAEASEIARSAAGDRRLEIETELARGAPTPALLDVSKKARLIVVGSRGHGEYTGGLVGSTSSALAVHSTCPVTVVRDAGAALEPGSQLPIVVGVDGTANSEPAIAAAFEEASLRNVRLLAVHAWSDMSLDIVISRYPDIGSLVKQDEERALLAETLAGFGEQYPDVQVDTELVKDKPSQNLCDHSRRAQLIVLGRRGRGGFSGLLLGSTCRSLLHEAHCPLMIVNSGR